ncbi:hypothetical protein Tco_1316364 [Tanacetum coccineum]
MGNDKTHGHDQLQFASTTNGLLTMQLRNLEMFLGTDMVIVPSVASIIVSNSRLLFPSPPSTHRFFQLKHVPHTKWELRISSAVTPTALINPPYNPVSKSTEHDTFYG